MKIKIAVAVVGKRQGSPSHRPCVEVQMNRIVYQSSVTKRLYYPLIYHYGGSCIIYPTLAPVRYFASPTPPPPTSSSQAPSSPQAAQPTTCPPAPVPAISDEDSRNTNNEDTINDLVQRGKSIMNAFVYQSSKRSERRRSRLARLRKRYKSIKAIPVEEEPWVDNRTVRQILFPSPSDMMEDTSRPKAKPTMKDYQRAAREAWALYLATWRGFWTSGMFVYDPLDDPPDGSMKNQNKKDVSGTLSKSSADSKTDVVNDDDNDNDAEHMSPNEAKMRLRRNVRRNTKLLRKGALRLREEVRERTGIQSTEDLKRVSAELMTLVSESIQEFLAGYREGRDGQVRRMLEEDLRKQQEDQAKAAASGDEKPPRRRRRRAKRRVLRR